MAEAIKLGVNEGRLQFTRGAKNFVLTSEGLMEFTGASHPLTKVAEAEGREILLNGLHQIHTNAGSLSNEVKAALPANIKLIPEGTSDLFKELRGSVSSSVEAAATIDKTITADALTEIAKKDSNAIKLLTEEQTKALSEAGHDIKAIETRATNELAKAVKLGELRTEFTKLAEGSDKAGRDAMDAFVKKNGAHIRELSQELDAATKAKFPIFANIEKAATDAEPLLKDLLRNKEMAQFHPNATIKADAAKEVTRLEGEVGKIYNRLGAGYETAIKAHLDPELAAKVHAISPKYGVAAEGLAEAAKTSGGKWYSLMKGEEALVETAAKKGVAVKDLGFLSKVRWGKTAIVGGVVVVAGYLAGIGRSRDKTHYTDQVAAQQGQAQGASIA